MNLAGTRILVTRPARQSGRLAQPIRDAGGLPVIFPTQFISPPNSPQDAADTLARLGEHDGVDLLIFVSPNAVDNALPFLPAHGLPANPTNAAIGPATAKAMEAVGLSVDITPRGIANSEGLLAEPEMQDIEGKQVIIVRGEGGRSLLGDTLRERGAHVAYAEVYSRTVPATPAGRFMQLCDDPGLDVAIATSNSALENLFKLAGDDGRELLLKLPLLVVGERAVALAKSLGFHNDIIVSKGAGSKAMISAIDEWKHEQAT